MIALKHDNVTVMPQTEQEYNLLLCYRQTIHVAHLARRKALAGLLCRICTIGPTCLSTSHQCAPSCNLWCVAHSFSVAPMTSTQPCGDDIAEDMRRCADLLQRYCPFMASIAPSDASKPSKLTKPKPLLAPVSGSRMILGVAMTMPKALKVSYRSCTTQDQLMTGS